MDDATIALAVWCAAALIIGGVWTDTASPRYRGPRSAAAAQIAGCLGLVAMLTVTGSAMWMRAPSLILAVWLIPEYRRRAR